MCACVPVSMSPCMQMCVHTCGHVCVCVHVCLCVHVHALPVTHVVCMCCFVASEPMRVHACVHACVSVSMRARAHCL